MLIPGIIGGIAPESTVDYYRRIVALYRARTSDGSYPPLLINSIDLHRLLGLVTSNRLDELVEFLVEELGRLKRAGADFGVFSSNTPHLVFDAIERRSPLPLISIVDTARHSAQERGFKRVGLLGTRFTMEARFYANLFSTSGISVFAPEPEERTFIHDRYMNELVTGKFLEESRNELLAIIERMRERDEIDAVVLGGTELPLLLRGSKSSVPLIDTAELHVISIVDRMLS